MRELPAGTQIAYGAEPDQFGTLFLPVGSGPHPLVIYLHGGYWRARYNHTISSVLCADLAQRGYAAWNLEYRRVGNPGGGWPGTFEDVTCGIEFTRTLATSYPLDLARVLVMGHSAGGHLALWAAVRGRIFPDSARDPVPLRGIIAQAPVADLGQAWERHLSSDAVVDLLGGTPTQVPERYAATDPARHLPLGVPLAILHGTADDAVPYAIAEQFATQAQAAGDRVTFLFQREADHFALVTPGTQQWEQCFNQVVRLLC